MVGVLRYGRDVPTIDGYDYAAEDTMLVAEPAQLRAMADPFRVQLVQLLRDRARSTQEISEELEVPKGTVGHHLKVLEAAGLIHVVRTRKVRALTEKFYGRTARLFLYQTEDPADGRAISAVTLRQAASEVDLAPMVTGFGLVRARLTQKDIDRFERRAKKLMDDFRAADRAGGVPSSLTGRHLGYARRTMRRPSGALWHHRDFMKMWTGQTISQFGSSISQLALPIIAIKAAPRIPPSRSPPLGTVEFLPFLLFTLPAGVWVDRLPRRAVLIVGDVGRGLLLLSVPIAYLWGHVTMAQLFVVGFTTGILTVFFDVAYQSYLPALVEREYLIEGNSKLEVTRSAGQLAGPAAAGGLIQPLTAPYAVVWDSVSFFISGAFLVGSATRAAARARGGQMWPQVKEGLHWVVGHRWLRYIASYTATANFCGSVLFAIFLLYAVRSLHLSAVELGVTLRSARRARSWRARREPDPAKVRCRPDDRGHSGLRVVRRHPLPARAALVPAALSDARAGDLHVRRRHLQHHPGEPAAGDHARATTGTHECCDALDRLGTIPLGTLTGGAIATGTNLKTALWVGAIGELFAAVPLLLSSVRKIGEMPAPVEEPTPAQAELEGGLVEGAPLPAPSSADA